MRPSGQILLIDDDSEALALLGRVLTLAGYQVRLADGGELALRAVAADPPDLILLDVHLNGIDGFEVCRRFKARADTRQIPIILIGGTGGQGEIVEGLRLGAADYIVKPFRTEELLARVAIHLSLRQAMVSLERQATELRQANEQLQSEAGHGRHLEDELRASLELAERSRRALLGLLEDQRRAETARQASDDHFRRAIVESPFPILLHAEDGTILQTSRSWCEITGYAPEELETIGDWIERAYGDRKELVRGDIDALYALDHGRYVGDYTIRIKDGTTRVWEFSSAPLGRLPNGSRLVMSMALDVTERRQAEETLRRSEERYRDVVENINDVLYTINSDGIITYVSSAVRRLGGFAPDELVGRSFAEIVHPDDLPEVARGFREVERDQTGPWEFRYRTKDGLIRWARASSRPILENGRPAGIRGMLTDITDRKLAENSLRETEARLRAVLDATPFPIAVVDLQDDRIHYWSNNALAIFGHTAPTAAEWYQIAYPDPDYRRELIARWKQHLETARETRQPVHTGEYQVTCRDGSVRVCELYASFLPDALVVIFNDITERKRAEGEKAKLEIQLQQSQKIESVGRLAGGVAHDFNNMLGVILGHVDLALKRVDPAEPLHEDLEEIRKAAVRSADLTRQLLAFARRQAIEPKVLDLNAAVAAILQMLKRLIGEEIDLRWQPQADLWPILMDPSQIDQILANLCVNSRDAIAGVGRVTIETGECSLTEEYCAAHPGFTPGEYVTLAVSDDGCGMDKGLLSHVFEPFFTTKVVGQGTGLGLATVYGIVKQNNGSIDVDSEPGQGTTIRIYLPRHVAGPGQGRAPGITPPSQRGDETILLVEDEAAILKLATRMLTMQGYTVLAAGTPGEAVRLASEHMGEIDLLMTDVVMPEMSGRELARNLLLLYPNLKCLFTSGYTADIIARRGVLVDGVHFVQKPFSNESLAAKVREALDSRGVEGT
jgi:PAS domain S-box-containing protein